jgi:hypothetical protein
MIPGGDHGDEVAGEPRREARITVGLKIGEAHHRGRRE